MRESRSLRLGVAGCSVALAVSICVIAMAGPVNEAGALTALPEYVCYMSDGAVYHTLPHGSEARPLVSPTAIPDGSAGLDHPVELISYSWPADGAYVSVLARSGKTEKYREFRVDVSESTATAASAPSAAKPAAFADGTPVDPPAEGIAKSPDGKMFALIKPDGAPGVPQVFVGTGSGTPVRVGPEEVRGRACSRVSFSPGNRYVAYEVAKPEGGSEVWITMLGSKQESFLAASSGSRPAWQPYYRPGKGGGSTSSGATGAGGSKVGGCCCGLPFLALALGLVGVAVKRRAPLA